MPLRIVYGRSGSGKTRYCFDAIKERIESGTKHPLILLVPEQYTFQAERDLIAILKTGGIINSEVLSFQRLAYRVFNEAGSITYPHIHPAGRAMMIYRIMDKLKGNLNYYAKSVNKEGFVNTISTQITEFKRYNVSPEDLERINTELAESSSLKEKLSELYMIYNLFEKTIADRYRDTDDDLTLAASKLEETYLFQGAEIWIDGFSGFTPQEYIIIAKLLRQAKRVTISLCTDNLQAAGYSLDVFAAVKSAADRLLKIAEEEVTIEPPVCLQGEPLYRFKESFELGHLEKNYFSYPYKTFDEETQNIRLFSSFNIYAEIEACAREIIYLCRDRSLRYRDIAVVTGDLDNYERLIEVLFKQYEIPCFLDRKVDITNHPLARLVLAMLDIFNENWSYEAVFRYLKTGLTGIERTSIDLLENYVLACGIRGSLWTKEEDWNMSTDLIPDEKARAGQDELLKEINRTRLQIISPLLEFRNRTKGRKKAAEFLEALYDFLCMIDVPARIENYIEQFKDEGALNLANEYSQVWNTLMDVFDQTVEVTGEETLGLERFSKILAVGLGEYKIGLVPASVDQVLIGSMDRSKSPEVKALFVLGLNDGVFPSGALEEGILSDPDRDTLRKAGLELANDTRTQAFEEQYLVYKTLTTSRCYLWLSWPIADQDGRSLRPSMVVSRLKKVFPKITETSNISKSHVDTPQLLAAGAPAFTEMIAAFREKKDGGEIPNFWFDVYKWFSSQEKWEDKFRTARTAFQYKNIVQPVNTNKVNSLFGNPAYISVSRLEKYTSCPFSFYVQYGLGARERKVYRLSPPDIGTFMHAVIERFSQIIEDEGISWRGFDRDWCKEKVSGIVDEMLEKMQGSGLAGSNRFTTLALRLKRVVTRAVWLIAEHMKRSSFEPVGYEVAFGDDAELPAITLELDSGRKIKLTGRIDRVDALETEDGTYLRIVDYKSGSKDFKLADAYYGLQIQLLTYLDALWENPGLNIQEPVIPGGILYFRIDDPLVRGKGSEEEIEKAIMKSLKMKGLLLADVKLIKEMDHTIERNSLIIPASLNKGDVLGKNSSVASLEHFYILRKYLRKLLKNLGEEMMQGNFKIRPYRKKNTTSCKFCSFSAICQFDPSLKENSYKFLPERKDEEIWEQIINDDDNI